MRLNVAQFYKIKGDTMKRKLLAGIVAFGLTVGMVTGSLYTVNGTGVVQAAEPAARAEGRTWDLTGTSAVERPNLQGNEGEYDGIQIDATNGKFFPRSSDVQINAGTILKVPVEANSDGAVLTISLSGNPATVEVNGQQYTFTNSTAIELGSSETDTTCEVTFLETQGEGETNYSSAYVASIALSYNEPAEEYPGVPENVQAADASYTFESAEGLLEEDGTAPADNTLEGERGTFRDMKVDATNNGKFAVQPANGRVQINAGTILYIPAAYDEAGAELLIAGTTNGSTPANITVNGEAATTNTRMALDMTDDAVYPQYIKVEFTEQAYVTGISLNYASDSDYPDPVVEAKDKVWDFTASSAVERPDLQGAAGEYDGIQIDASTGKFSPRDTDTQVNAGTTLYIPVAPDAEGASITVAGNNYNNLTLTLNGETISVGEETALPAVEKNTYVALEFSSADGTGSCYLYNISVDYVSDSEVSMNTVTVGAGEGYDYSSIQAALDANESSASTPLVIQIAPGTYSEKITVDKPWVSFQPLYSNGGDIIIEESYYSSNTFNENGQFVPQDKYDLGTDQCGTVLLTANATGFSATGITFQNSYNVVDHTGEGEQTPAVAFGSAADRVYLKDCKFIGRQDTLYLHGAGARVQVENCYIEGTVDFIFGDADAYFTGCELHMAGFAGRDTGYFTAANTKEGDTGLVFYQCTLTVDESYGEGSTVSLGRPWQTECYTESVRTKDGTFVTEYDPDRKNPSYENTASSVTFVECTMDPAIQNERWNVWTRKDTEGNTLDVTYHDDVHFAEYNSKDVNGEYLNPEDYKDDIVLGTMAVTDDAEGMIGSLLGDMGFGEGIGNWTPSLPDAPTQELPGTEEPGTEEPGTTTPGGEDTEKPGDSGNTGNTGDTGSGSNNGNGGSTTVTDNKNNAGSTDKNVNSGSAVKAAKTGDSTNVMVYAGALVVSVIVLAAVVIALRVRKK